MNIATPAEIEIAPAKAPHGQSVAPLERTLLSMVIPVRDGAGSLPATLNAITDWITRSTVEVEVVVIDDGSSDTTRATASSFGRRIANLQVLRHVERRGQLEAVRTGEGASRGELIAFGRAPDLEWSLARCADLLDAVLAGADVAILPVAPEGRLTPIPRARTRGIAGTCVDWLLRRAPEPLRDPALVVCRASALRQMIAAARPDEIDPDWTALARRAKCALSVVRRGRPSTRSRLLPARSA